MSQVTVTTTTEDGYIVNSPLAVFKTQNDIVLSANDSIQSIVGEGYFFFDTRDAVTGLPANAIIDSITLTYFVSAFTLTLSNGGFSILSCDDACIGSTLETADFQGVTQHLEITTQPEFVGSYVTPITSINRSGYTNIRMLVNSLGTPVSVTIDAREKPGGHPAFLTITYHVPAGGVVSVLTTYDLDMVNAGSAGIAFSSLATPERDGRWIPDEHLDPGPTPPVKVFRPGGLQE